MIYIVQPVQFGAIGKKERLQFYAEVAIRIIISITGNIIAYLFYKNCEFKHSEHILGTNE